MNIFSLILGADTAGISGRLSEAFIRHGQPDVLYSMVRSTNYIDYPKQLEWDQHKAAELWEWADAIHMNHGMRTAKLAVQYRRLGKRISHKPYIVHLHGTQEPDRARWFKNALNELKGWKNTQAVVSTLDLQLDSGLPWLPAPYDVDWLETLRNPIQDDVIRIAHAPTHRELKSTDLIIATVGRLKNEGYPVELDVIERVPWGICLLRKSTADIYVDQLKLGYGCNALEAWGMGIPVIAGAYREDVLAYMEETLTGLPFAWADDVTLYAVLKQLVESKAQRVKWGLIGHEYVRRYHDYPFVVDTFRSIAGRLLTHAAQ